MNRWKFLKELSLVFLLFLLAFFGMALLANWWTARHTFQLHEVESNLFFINENEQVDMVVLGISHARNFSRQANHAITENALNKNILNLGRGNGLCGLHGQQLYLDFFFENGNSTGEVLFIATPPLMYGTYLDQNQTAFWDEPIRFDFSKFIIKNGDREKHWQLFQSFVRKLRPSWLSFQKYPNEPMTAQIEKVDPIIIEEGMKLAYPKGRRIETLQENIIYFKKIVSSTKINGAKLIVVIPPAVFGKWPGHEETMEWLQKVKELEDFKIMDLSEAILDKTFYYDHHHLNSEGVQKFWDIYRSK